MEVRTGLSSLLIRWEMAIIEGDVEVGRGAWLSQRFLGRSSTMRSLAAYLGEF